MKRFFYLIPSLLFFHSGLTAQEQPVGPDIFMPFDEFVMDTVEMVQVQDLDEMLYVEDSIEAVYYDLAPNVEFIPGDDSPLLIADRLRCIEQSIPLHYNDKIHAFINYFTVKDREYTRLMIRRKNLYFPIFEKYLEKYGLPEELKYLAIIESGLNPRATSRVRAVGLWQFMSATGRYYGLHNDWYIDERMDPEKSTDAACRYLRDLYKMFNDWELALAAYNTGPGNVKRAIRRSGYKKSFWDIYPFLPRETRSYVPQFVAIMYTMNHLDEHNFVRDEQEMLVQHDTIMVGHFLNLETFAALTGTCVEDLQKLNPSIRHNAVPDTPKGYLIRVPVAANQVLTANRAAILDSASKVGRKELELLASRAAGNTYGRERIVYQVRSGDVLGKIALRYGVRVNDIKTWNNLSGTVIRTGQRLTLWVNPARANNSVVAKSNPIPATAGSGQKVYTVQPGDTLWDITKKFNGLTVEKIRALNNLTGNKIHPGQKLIVGI